MGEALQLELSVLQDISFAARGEDRKKVNARIEAILASNQSLRIDVGELGLMRHWPRLCRLIGAYPEGGCTNVGHVFVIPLSLHV